ncbi:hypothetical protein [Streptomyces prasinopilosus]|uniref:hypothetical protein n=1 Tax=Streptomyces prasinopilosus TaxID=67344 RepID=UPI001586D60F|nr:hypothetical protein [Streptomyces prasinopilosus]
MASQAPISTVSPSTRMASRTAGSFFEAVTWEGEPVNKETEKCLALTWFTVHELPDGVIEYPGAGLLGHLGGTGPLTVHNWP